MPTRSAAAALAWMVCATATFACSNAQRSWQITGQLLEEYPRDQPIEGAQVTIASLHVTTVTDSLGNYHLSLRARAGCYRLDAWSIGHQPAYHNLLLKGSSDATVGPIHLTQFPFEADPTRTGTCVPPDTLFHQDWPVASTVLEVLVVLPDSSVPQKVEIRVERPCELDPRDYGETAPLAGTTSRFQVRLYVMHESTQPPTSFLPGDSVTCGVSVSESLIHFWIDTLLHLPTSPQVASPAHATLTLHPPSPPADTVLVSSNGLHLHGRLYRPPGPGPFPTVLFSHGSERNPTVERADELGQTFGAHGYALLFLFRRGQGSSAGEGIYLGDVLDRQLADSGQEGFNRLQLRLMETEQLNDAREGLAFLRGQPDVDPSRIAVIGHSFGGSLSLLLAEADTGLRAVVDFAGAAMSWDRSPLLRARLLAAARSPVPAFLIHAANDYSVAPGEALAAEKRRLGKPYRLLIYPPSGTTPEDGHALVYLAEATWTKDVFAFLGEYMHR